MTKRQPIGKKLRFEVFKRDKFTCQYCGKKAPDVILEIDHVIPVAEGGTNEIINLVTACRDCNRGKGKIRLDQTSEVDVQRGEIEKLQERKEQVEMLLEWRNELKEVADIEREYILSLFNEAGVSVDYKELKMIDTGIRSRGLAVMEEATNIYLSHCDGGVKNKPMKYLLGIARNISEQKNNPYAEYEQKACAELAKLGYDNWAVVKGLLESYHPFRCDDDIIIFKESYKLDGSYSLLEHCLMDYKEICDGYGNYKKWKEEQEDVNQKSS